jgi:hypothetical protein
MPWPSAEWAGFYLFAGWEITNPRAPRLPYRRLQAKDPGLSEEAALAQWHSRQTVLQPLTETELEHVGFQVASAVLAAKEPLYALRHISENFPSLVHAFATGAGPRQNVVRAIGDNQNSLRRVGLDFGCVPPAVFFQCSINMALCTDALDPLFRSSFLTMNSVVLDINTLNVHTLLRALGQETRALDTLAAWGVPGVSTVDALRTVPPQEVRPVLPAQLWR